MKRSIAFWQILLKDVRAYYLKPPNISWGIIFPLAWTGMFLLRSGQRLDDIITVFPGVIAISILFGTTSMLAVTITFEKKNASFDRLILAPLPLELLMIAKTSGAIVFGILNAFVTIAMSSVFVPFSQINWLPVFCSIILIAISSTFMGLFIAVSVSEVFEAQTFSNFFRFPMIFLCGLFFPIQSLPIILQLLSFVFPLTYGVDILKYSVDKSNFIPVWFSFIAISLFCAGLFFVSLKNIHKKWIL